MEKSPKTGLAGLLRPEDSILLLIDHQPYQVTNLNSHEPTIIVNNVVALAKTAKVFKVPTVLTTVIEERGGYIIKALLKSHLHNAFCAAQKKFAKRLINSATLFICQPLIIFENRYSPAVSLFYSFL
jgi:isochorismate hydrolase